MTTHRVVSRKEWIDARRQHLAREKELTRLRDTLSRERRDLPWVRVDTPYVFDGPAGRESLADLFGGRPPTTTRTVASRFRRGPASACSTRR